MPMEERNFLSTLPPSQGTDFYLAEQSSPAPPRPVGPRTVRRLEAPALPPLLRQPAIPFPVDQGTHRTRNSAATLPGCRSPSASKQNDHLPRSYFYVFPEFPTGVKRPPHSSQGTLRNAIRLPVRPGSLNFPGEPWRTRTSSPLIKSPVATFRVPPTAFLNLRCCRFSGLCACRFHTGFSGPFRVGLL